MVATPIGHLGDISRRGIDTLNHVGIIAAEDTRRTRVLLQHIDHTGCELVSVHEHNEERVGPVLIERMRQGTDIALVSDAGTPLINDPGYHLLQLAWQAGIRVVPIPGACSIITALSVCPIPCQPFRYVGFLSSKPKLRRTQLERPAPDRCSSMARHVDGVEAKSGAGRSSALSQRRTKHSIYPLFS